MNGFGTSSLARWGLLPLRMVVGLVFILHGGQKLFVFGLDGTTGFMESIGVPLPAVAAVVVTFVELVGGLAILIGWFTRTAALLLAVDMIVAILLVRLPGGFFAPDGFEFELTLLGACLTLAALGPGGASLEATMRGRPPVEST